MYAQSPALALFLAIAQHGFVTNPHRNCHRFVKVDKGHDALCCRYVRANHTLPLGMISLDDFLTVLAQDLVKSKSKDQRKHRKVLRMQTRMLEIKASLGTASKDEEYSLQNEMAALEKSIAKKTKELEHVGIPVEAMVVAPRPTSPLASGTGDAGGTGEYEAEEDVFVNPLQQGRAVAQDVEGDET